VLTVASVAELDVDFEGIDDFRNSPIPARFLSSRKRANSASLNCRFGLLGGVWFVSATTSAFDCRGSPGLVAWHYGLQIKVKFAAWLVAATATIKWT